MNYRIADQTSNTDFSRRINSQRNRLSILQERITSGKRINRASDDPAGAVMVLNLRTSQAEIDQFQRNVQAADQKLTLADDSLGSYETMLGRIKTLISQGLTGTTTQEARNAIATEVESLHSRILAIANTKSGDEYVFGGTRQNVPPFDPATAAPAGTPTSQQFIQIEPGANALAVGVTADTVFSDATSTIFTDLTDAVAALRGTGVPATDTATLQNTFGRLATYSAMVNNSLAVIGANMNSTEMAHENLSNNFLSLDERASAIEGADFAETAVALTDAQRALDATLQVAATGRRSLFDFLS